MNNSLFNISVNNMTCVTCDPEEGGAAKVRKLSNQKKLKKILTFDEKVRDLLENHTPLLCSIIKVEASQVRALKKLLKFVKTSCFLATLVALHFTPVSESMIVSD